MFYLSRHPKNKQRRRRERKETGIRMDRAQKEREKRMKRRHSLDDVLLAVIGRMEREGTHFRECTYEHLSAPRSTLFWGKVGQDKLRAYTHAEQHPRTLPRLCGLFFFTLSFPLPPFSFSPLHPFSSPPCSVLPSLPYFSLECLCFVIPSLIFSIHLVLPALSLSSLSLSPFSLWSASPSSSHPPSLPLQEMSNLHCSF